MAAHVGATVGADEVVNTVVVWICVAVEIEVTAALSRIVEVE